MPLPPDGPYGTVTHPQPFPPNLQNVQPASANIAGSSNFRGDISHLRDVRYPPPIDQPQLDSNQYVNLLHSAGFGQYGNFPQNSMVAQNSQSISYQPVMPGQLGMPRAPPNLAAFQPGNFQGAYY